MSFLDVDLNGTIEPTVAPADTEYQIRLVAITEGNDKNGNPYILPRFDVPDLPASKEFTKFLYLPREGLTEKEANNIKWNLVSFFTAMGIDYTKRIALDEVCGNTAWAILGISQDAVYGEQNYIKRFVSGK